MGGTHSASSTDAGAAEEDGFVLPQTTERPPVPPNRSRADREHDIYKLAEQFAAYTKRLHSVVSSELTPLWSFDKPVLQIICDYVAPYLGVMTTIGQVRSEQIALSSYNPGPLAITIAHDKSYLVVTEYKESRIHRFALPAADSAFSTVGAASSVRTTLKMSDGGFFIRPSAICIDPSQSDTFFVADQRYIQRISINSPRTGTGGGDASTITRLAMVEMPQVFGAWVSEGLAATTIRYSDPALDPKTGPKPSSDAPNTGVLDVYVCDGNGRLLRCAFNDPNLAVRLVKLHERKRRGWIETFWIPSPHRPVFYQSPTLTRRDSILYISGSGSGPNCLRRLDLTTGKCVARSLTLWQLLGLADGWFRWYRTIGFGVAIG